MYHNEVMMREKLSNEDKRQERLQTELRKNGDQLAVSDAMCRVGSEAWLLHAASRT